MIKSSVLEAEGAVAGFEISDVSGERTALNESNIAGMHEGVEIANGLVDMFLELEGAVYKQSQKFPDLARVIAARDRRDALVLSGVIGDVHGTR
jgi:hypothetical protein